MSILGIRVSPKIVYLSIINKEEFINQELAVPVNIDSPRRLAYLRSNIISIIKENQIQCIGLRVTENNAQSFSIDRLNIEGVIKELMADCNIIFYETFVKSQMVKILNTNHSELKEWLDLKSESYPSEFSIKDWQEIKTKEARESLLTAFCVEVITSE